MRGVALRRRGARAVRAVLVMLAVGGVLPLGFAPGAAASGAGGANASCLGLGSSFYGQFAPRQRAFVAAFVNDQATATGQAPGSIYTGFAQEKEGGSIPAPCGTRIE